MENWLYLVYVVLASIQPKEEKLTKKNITKKMLFVKVTQIMQPIMNLGDWKINVKFSKAESMKQTATCQAYPEYKLAHITVNEPILKDLTRAEVVSTVIHEMAHCILWEMGEWAMSLSDGDRQKTRYSRKYEEAAVTRIEHVLFNLAVPIINTSLDNMGYHAIETSLPNVTYSMLKAD